MGSFCKVVANSIVMLKKERRKSMIESSEVVTTPQDPPVAVTTGETKTDQAPPVDQSGKRPKKNQVAPDLS